MAHTFSLQSALDRAMMMNSQHLYTVHIDLLENNETRRPIARYSTNAVPPRVGDKMNLRELDSQTMYLCRVVEITITPTLVTIQKERKFSSKTLVQVIVIAEEE